MKSYFQFLIEFSSKWIADHSELHVRYGTCSNQFLETSQGSISYDPNQI